MELQEIVEQLVAGVYKVGAKELYQDIYEEDARSGNYDVLALDYFQDLLMKEDIASYLEIHYGFSDSDIAIIFAIADDFIEEEHVIGSLTRIKVLNDFAICHRMHKDGIF